MATKQSEVERAYFFPHLGITVKAKSLEEVEMLAQKAANEDKQ